MIDPVCHLCLVYADGNIKQRSVPCSLLGYGLSSFLEEPVAFRRMRCASQGAKLGKLHLLVRSSHYRRAGSKKAMRSVTERRVGWSMSSEPDHRGRCLLAMSINVVQ